MENICVDILELVLQLIGIIVLVLASILLPIYFKYRKAQDDLMALLFELHSNALNYLRFKVSGKSLLISQDEAWNNFKKNGNLMRIGQLDDEFHKNIRRIESAYQLAYSRKELAKKENNSKAINDYVEELKKRYFSVYNDFRKCLYDKKPKVYFRILLSKQYIEYIEKCFAKSNEETVMKKSPSKWSNLIPVCFGIEDFEFGQHPLDEERAKKMFEVAIANNATLDGILEECRKFLNAKKMSKEHIEKQLIIVEKMYNQNQGGLK